MRRRDKSHMSFDQRGERTVTPLQTIAVGYDGSIDAETAVRWALDLASSTHGMASKVSVPTTAEGYGQ